MKWRRYSVLGFFVCGLGVSWCLFSLTTQKRTCKLGDGSELTLESIEVGTNAVFYLGNSIQRWATKCSAVVGARLGGGLVRYTGNSRQTNVAIALLYRGNRNLGSDTLLRIRDDDGIESNPRFVVHPNPVSGGATRLFCFGGTLTHRSREIALVIYDNVPREPVLLGELRMTNPLFSRFADWTPSRLPITNRADQLIVTLREAVTGHDLGWRDADGRISSDYVARFSFGMLEDERPTDEWDLFQIHCGNSAIELTQPWRGTMKRTGPGNLDVSGEWPLWPGRNAIKLKTSWVKTVAESPDHVVIFRRVPLAPTRSLNAAIWTSFHVEPPAS